MPAADRFIPLATWLAGAPEPVTPAELSPEPPPAAPPEPGEMPEPAHRPEPEPEPAEARAVADVLRDVRLFRARLAEALETAAAALLRELAYAVLGRELRGAPADVAALAARILAEHPAAVPVTIRHAPGEPVDLGVPSVADPALAPGDLVVAFADGEIDARLGVRLAAVLEAT